MRHRILALGLRGVTVLTMVLALACSIGDDDAPAGEQTDDLDDRFPPSGSRSGTSGARRASADDDEDQDEDDFDAGTEHNSGREPRDRDDRDSDESEDPTQASPEETAPGYGELREAADGAERWLGTTIDAALLEADSEYARLLASEFNAITLTDALRWSALEAQRGVRAFDTADALVDAARARGQSVRGHALIGHDQLPSWAMGLPPADLRTAIEQHVIETVGHFRGKVYAWDVIHEALDPDTLLLRPGLYASLGISGLAEVFKWANQIDPDALLFYSDSDIEAPTPRAQAVQKLIRDLEAHGATVDGIGMAAHLDTSGYPAEGPLRANIARFAELAPVVSYAALDVTTKRADPTANPTRRRDAQRLVYQLIAGVCASEPACRGLTIWGLTDRVTWSPDDEPLIFDAQYEKKPAYEGLLAGLSGRTPALDDEQLLVNPDFSEGELGWSAFGGGRLAVQNTLSRSGPALTVSERTQEYEGLGQSLLGKLSSDHSVCVSAWVRLEAGSAAVTATIKHGTGIEATDRYQQLAHVTANSNDWVELAGCGAVYADPTATEITLFIAGAPPGATLHIDDVSLRPLVAR